MTINSDGTWSLSDDTDTGYWAVSGKDIILSDSIEAIWIAPLAKHRLASAKKPGTVTDAGQTTTFATFYTLG